MTRDTTWQRSREGWERHVAGYAHPLAVEGAARKYGARLGPLFVDLLARRLREVSVDRDGARLDLACAWRRCDAWAHEGQTARAA